MALLSSEMRWLLNVVSQYCPLLNLEKRFASSSATYGGLKIILLDTFNTMVFCLYFLFSFLTFFHTCEEEVLELNLLKNSVQLFLIA